MEQTHYDVVKTTFDHKKWFSAPLVYTNETVRQPMFQNKTRCLCHTLSVQHGAEKQSVLHQYFRYLPTPTAPIFKQYIFHILENTEMT